MVNAPDRQAPAFLMSVSPDPSSGGLGVGRAIFTLTFSKPMNMAAAPSVTFGLAAPFAAHVVEPAPGWVSPTVWQGSFAIQSDTGDGASTLRVAGAAGEGGLAIPEDTAHRFTIDTKAGLGANNGLAIGQGTKMRLSWPEAGKPATALGYNVQRSATGLPGSYQKINMALLTAPSYTDQEGLAPETMYFYQVFVVDAQNNATQWTPPFAGKTGDPQNAAGSWALYE